MPTAADATPLRLFAALLPPPAVVADLRRVIAPLRDTDQELRWDLPQLWHVTLAFMAAVPPGRLAPLTGELGRVASATSPLHLALAGAGAFRRPHAARTIWAGISGDTESLASLAAACQDAAKTVQVEVASAPTFRPHLTLARARRRPINAEQLLTALAGYASPTWTATELILIRSHLGAGPNGRPRHEPVATLPLGTAARNLEAGSDR